MIHSAIFQLLEDIIGEELIVMSLTTPFTQEGKKEIKF
jgi:hypothetical protein